MTDNQQAKQKRSVIINGQKRCNKCHIFKPLDQFNSLNRVKDKKNQICKSCYSAVRKEGRANGKYNYSSRAKGKNPKYTYGTPEYKDSWLKKKYRISLAEYNKILDSQNGKCAICLQYSDKNLYVDHNHNTGKIRGLLCLSCNIAIGHLKDDTKLLISALRYLENTRDN